MRNFARQIRALTLWTLFGTLLLALSLAGMYRLLYGGSTKPRIELDAQHRDLQKTGTALVRLAAIAEDEVSLSGIEAGPLLDLLLQLKAAAKERIRLGKQFSAARAHTGPVEVENLRRQIKVMQGKAVVYRSRSIYQALVQCLDFLNQVDAMDAAARQRDDGEKKGAALLAKSLGAVDTMAAPLAEKRRLAEQEMSRSLSVVFTALLLGTIAVGAALGLSLRARGSLDELSAAWKRRGEAFRELKRRLADAALVLQTPSRTTARTAIALREQMDLALRSADGLGELIATVTQRTKDAAQAGESAQRSAEQAAANVAALRTAGDRIRSITETMARLAQRTQLLALNASIEASRAGAAGSGFGVVAGEVRTLAVEAQEATRSIGQQVEGVSVEVTSIAGAIESVVAAMAKVCHAQSAISAAMLRQEAAAGEIGTGLRRAGQTLAAG